MKLNPFVGLNSLSKEEYKTATSFDLYQKVEELVPSYQEGQVSDYFLFLLFINVLVKGKVDFLVKGGTLLNIFLKEHARRSTDIDVLISDPDLFYEQVNEAIKNGYDGFIFKTKWIKKSEANQNYYRNTFAFSVEAYFDDKLIKSFVVDGVFTDHYQEIEKVKYNGPKIIDEKFYFYGVEPEYIVSEKILASTSEQPRPIKHLIDLYSFIKLNLDLTKVKKNLSRDLNDENKVREKYGVPPLTNKLIISPQKEFFDSYFFTAISAGYQISQEEMVEEINEWLISL